MSIGTIRFHVSDLSDPVPELGWHEAIVHAARQRMSERGNPTVQVIYHLPEVSPDRDRVTEYFPVAGDNPRAAAIGRRRLWGLCRACGVRLREGDQLHLDDLIGRELEIHVSHESWQGSKRARVSGCRPRSE